MSRDLISALFVGTAIVAMATPAAAQEREFNIPAGSLKKALDTFARQSGQQVIYRADDLRGVRSKGARGRITTGQALDVILAGTGFTVRKDTSGALAIIDARSETQAKKEPRTTADTSNTDAENLGRDDILVTGTRLRTGAPDQALPVNVYTRERIDASGQSDLAGFLGTLNEVSVVSANSSFSPRGGQSVVQMRGLPVGSTLVLLNGRRIHMGASGNSSYFNLDLIPFAAIDRLEVVPVGSSAVYGGDALAGVLNIVTKSASDGFTLEARRGTADGTHDTSVSAYAGKKFERGSIFAVASYSNVKPLYSQSRDFFRDADYRRFGGTDNRVRTCDLGTVSSASGANLPGLSSPNAGIPAASTGRPTIADFAATAGQVNLCALRTQGYGLPLINETRTFSSHVFADYDVGPWLTLFGEFSFSKYENDAKSSSISLSNVLVPASNAYNPFGVAVRVNGRLAKENGDTGNTIKSTFYRGVIGARGEIGRDWSYEASLSYSHDDSNSTSRGVANSTALNAALVSSDPNTALNLFNPTGLQAPGVVRTVWPDNARTGLAYRRGANGFVRGVPFSLPAGDVEIVLGGELSTDRWNTRTPTTTNDLSRNVRSVFGETRLPILASHSGSGGSMLQASLAGRIDHYSDFGTASTYQVGLEFRPLDGVLLRLANATSFKPPSLLQLNPTPSTFSSNIFGLRDPKNGNALISGATVTFGANPNLRPERGDAITFGLVLQPKAIPGMRLEISRWSVELSDSIIFPSSPQFLLANEDQLPGYVVRATPGGQVTGILWPNVNFGLTSVSGVDFSARQSLSSGLGKWTFQASATYTSKYEVTITPGTAPQNRAGKLATEAWAPKWKGQFGVQLDTTSIDVGASARLVSTYEDTGASTLRLGGYAFLDAYVNFDLKRILALSDHFPQTLNLSISGVNLTNRLPQYSAAPAFYDITQGDWRGRYIVARLSTSF